MELKLIHTGYTLAKIQAAARRRQRGIAALELALILPIFLVLLTLPLFFGRIFWHYSVVERAAQDAARYLSSIPLSEMKNPARASAVSAVATAIVNDEIAELAPGPDPIVVTVSCDVGPCLGYSVPQTVNVNIKLLMSDIFFSNVTSLAVPLTASATYPYLAQ